MKKTTNNMTLAEKLEQISEKVLELVAEMDESEKKSGSIIVSLNGRKIAHIMPLTDDVDDAKEGD